MSSIALKPWGLPVAFVGCYCAAYIYHPNEKGKIMSLHTGAK
jgi:hypothetical protein